MSRQSAKGSFSLVRVFRTMVALVALVVVGIIALVAMNTPSNHSQRLASNPIAESESTPTTDSRPNANMGNASDAWSAIQRFVTDELKAPTSASFPAEGLINTHRKDGGVWAVESYVDAVNSFNAKIRTHFYCEVKRETGASPGWELVTLRFTDR